MTTLDAGGRSPASAPAVLTTSTATIPPAAPVITHNWWAQQNLLAVSWNPGSTGNSPIDEYEVSSSPYDSGAASRYATVVVRGSTSA